MKYEIASNQVKRTYTVRCGYFGKTEQVGLAFDPENNRAIEVADCGCYGANTRKYTDEAEMLYFFDNHRKIHFPQAI